MFDIGFWEIAVIAVVALLVVGPEEFPALVRTVGSWLGKVRRFLTDTKNDLEKEFHKADELKKRIEKEAEIVERHRKLDLNRAVVPAGEKTAEPGRESDDTGTETDEDKPENRASHGTSE